MQVTGKIHKIGETATFGASGFRKRELVVQTDEQYPQLLMVEFVQDKCDLLDAFAIGQSICVSINLRGKEWINPEGKAVYFNSIQGWRIEASDGTNQQGTPLDSMPPKNSITDDSEPDDLPF